MLWTPPAKPQRSLNFPANPGTSSASAVATAGATGVKGAWASIIDPLPFAGTLLAITVQGTNTSATRTDVAMDIGVGPTGGGSEQVLIPDLLCGWASGSGGGKVYLVPITIPQGVRISARIAALIGADQAEINIAVYGGGPDVLAPGFAGCDVYGLSGQVGTSHTPGASGVESAWANIGGTTSRHYDAIFPVVQGTLADTTMTGEGALWELGWNSGAPILGRYAVFSTTSENVSGMWPPLPIYHPIPSGTQLQVRAESSIATPEAHDVALYCLY